MKMMKWILSLSENKMMDSGLSRTFVSKHIEIQGCALFNDSLNLYTKRPRNVRLVLRQVFTFRIRHRFRYIPYPNRCPFYSITKPACLRRSTCDAAHAMQRTVTGKLRQHLLPSLVLKSSYPNFRRQRICPSSPRT